jgi:tRNA-dihydrouridine synthase B
VSAGLLQAMDFDAVDFNMGCPVRKVMQRQAGAALMRNPDNALTCLKILRDSTDKPVTVKTRILSETDPEPTVRFCEALAGVGIDGLTIHGRLAGKVYSGPVAYSVIKAVREALKIPVCANGGIFSRADALRLAAETGCQRLMVARGAIGNPWIFQELQAEEYTPPSHQEICEVMHEHLQQMRDFYGEELAMVIGRKIVQSYLVGRGYRRSLRHQAVQICSWQDFQEFHRQVAEEGPRMI